MFSYDIDSIDQLPVVAEKITAMIPDHPVIAFYGEMGAGKTTLIAEICALLDVTDTPASPTFALINQYYTVRGTLVNHFDFYRIETEREALDIGCEEYFYSGDPCLIEWPEKVESLLPENTLRVRIGTHFEQPGKRTFLIGKS